MYRLLVLVLAACAGRPAPGPTASVPARPAASSAAPSAAIEQTQLVASRNGVPLHFTSALAFLKPSGQVEIFVSTRAHDCTTRDQDVARDEIRFQLILMTKLHPTGRAEWRVAGFDYANLGSWRDDGAPLARASIDPRPGKHSQLTVEEAGQARRLHDGQERDILTLTGTIDAIGCGDRWVEAAKHDVQPGMIEVATHALPIVDAVLVEGVAYNRAGTRVVVSTKAIDCSTARSAGLAPWVIVLSTAAQLTVELELESGATPMASVSGDWIGESPRTFYGPAGELSATPTTIGAAPTVTMTLDGSATLPRRGGGDGFPVSIRGTVRARVCRIEPAKR